METKSHSSYHPVPGWITDPVSEAELADIARLRTEAAAKMNWRYGYRLNPNWPEFCEVNAWYCQAYRATYGKFPDDDIEQKACKWHAEIRKKGMDLNAQGKKPQARKSSAHRKPKRGRRAGG